jgi:integrase
MALTVLQVKNIKPKSKDFKVSDAGGLYLHVKSNGAKYWRLAYRFNHKQKTLALGVYPEVSLQEAREKASEAKKLLKDGIDPSENKKASKSESDDSFQAVATEWFNKQKTIWVESHTKDVRRRLEKDIYPKIGQLSISQITSMQVLEVVRVIEKRQATDLAHRVLGVCSQVFRYAVSSGKLASDPTRDLKGALTPHVQKHQNAIAPEEMAKLMKDINTYDNIGALQTKLALIMLAHTFVRTGELIEATWNEFDFEKCMWKIPASRMKMKREHIVPLTPQVIAILKLLKELSYNSDYVFAGRNPQKPISNNTLLFALYKLGYKRKMTGHGFRSVASTSLNESGFRADIIERQLAHLDGNSVRAAYNRAEYMKERIEMMTWWSNHLDSMIKPVVEQPEELLLAA